MYPVSEIIAREHLINELTEQSDVTKKTIAAIACLYNELQDKSDHRKNNPNCQCTHFLPPEFAVSVIPYGVLHI